jgi:hypothetical protein
MSQVLLVYAKLPSGLTVPLEVDRDTSVAELKETIARSSQQQQNQQQQPATPPRRKRPFMEDNQCLQGSACRILFAGRELGDDKRLSDYNLGAESELHVLLRRHDETASRRAQLRGKVLQDYIVQERVGGKAVGPASPPRSPGYSMSGVCSYVYRARLRGDAVGAELALKVMINMTGASETLQIDDEFEAECNLLSDALRLPPHPNIMTVFSSFTDTAAGLPEWDFDADIGNSRTMILVMPFYSQDLKYALQSARNAGQLHLPDVRAAKLSTHLLRAVSHLKDHGILHRDIKPDNVRFTRTRTLARLKLKEPMCCDAGVGG